MRKRLLIVVTGPVSWGKGTTASALAVYFRSRGLTTAKADRHGLARAPRCRWHPRKKEGQMMVREDDANRAVGGTRGWSQS